ncbi:type VI secretion system lipoprotein TssJ [Burkholderia dolosa]|uniref:type VI secretion system lipoprotein TssJ n=1 Tax=Burkholderia dolosa TaxID=152500 RepID=UPI0015925878|nr:type VI secretion system lipoprotein TssJ [Burkholderia dolosa]MBR8056191.1 type VI secretion system lipoprotein TssJ [Burkholderia dolosa]MBR8460149.1 type VI secretion system lipoprotein TssJ [Burkholderia dolosa]MBY4750888.1 type VI secretion system lipoprotein TssJ [Burkholderia dolosa]MBY4830136.1 type VI secretion system lipoprotein TssJ [Burkholderia dolosa]MDN7420394.1 type VI secretion system lipoprotein TssJ [Burkholderia dolosa]
MFSRLPHDTVTRRDALERIALGLSFLSLTACAGAPNGPKPASLNLKINVSAGVNPDELGRPAPIMVRIYELKSAYTFDNADFFTLQSDSKKALGDDAIAIDEFVLRPGDVANIRRRINAATTAVGVLAGYRELGKSVWRGVYRLPPRPDEAWLRLFAAHTKIKLNVDIGQRAVLVTELD